MSTVTLYGNNPSTTIATNGYNGSATADTPSSGTSETGWTFTSLSGFPVASSTAVPPTQFTIADPAAPTELIYVTSVSGNVATVTRGAESTTPVTHAAGATFVQIVSAGDLTKLKQATGAITSPVSVHGTTTESVVCTYQPVAGEVVAGTTFELVATGTIQLTSNPTITWTLRWGGVSGTSLLALVSGTNCSALTSSMSVARPFDVNGTVTFITATSAIANLNFWFGINGATSVGTGVASSASAVTGLTASPGGGPLVLTAKWSTTSTQNSVVVPGPLAYRAA